MPHARNRHALAIVLKKLKFSRVVSLQGPRQTGKSFLARHLLTQELESADYVTLDDRRHRGFASENPHSFLEMRKDSKPLIIDEAQKAPDLFDAVKLAVDEDPRPGQFVLLGSTEFSREMKIRESLTGRLSRVLIYPFNLAEAESLKPRATPAFGVAPGKPRATRNAVFRQLERGGFPGIFSVRDENERNALFQGWLDLTCQRDIFQFQGKNADSELADLILRTLAVMDQPDLASLGRKIPSTSARIRTHLRLLEQLFAIQRLNPHPLGTGKVRYHLCDVGLCSYLGADLGRKLSLWLWQEAQSQDSYAGAVGRRFSYYRGARGGTIDLVIEERNRPPTAIKILAREKLDFRDLEILKAFDSRWRRENTGKPRLVALAPISSPEQVNGIEIYPWESIA